MQKAERIRWHAPQKVTDWQRAQVESLIWTFWLITVKTGWSLFLIGLLVTFFWKRPIAYEESFNQFIKTYLLSTFFFPPLFTLSMTAQFIFALFQKNSDEHGVNQKGLFCHSGLNALNIIWRRFDIYRFVDHAVLEGIRVFEFTLKPIKYIGDKKERWYKFYFDPNEIDENQIQEIIDLNSSA